MNQNFVNNDMSYKTIVYYLIFKILIPKIIAEISVIDRGISPLEKKSVAIKFYVDIENVNRIDPCEVYTRVKKCCLTYLDKEDCDMINVIGESSDIIKPRDRKTLIYVFPTLCQHDLVGYCVITLDYVCVRGRDTTHVNIPLDTRVFRSRRLSPLLKTYLSGTNTETCDTLDQNSLENCNPIDCDLKYAGQRPFYEKSIKRCIKAPICTGDSNNDLPSIVYVPQINICKSLDLPLSGQDIYAISTGLGTITKSSKKKDEIKVVLKSNCSTISQNLYFLKDLMYGKLCPCDDNAKVNFEDGCKSAILTIVFCVISICAVLLSFIFCVNTSVWVHRQWSKGNINAFMLIVKNKFKRSEKKTKNCRINSEIRNSLLREVIVRDIPLELRDSAVSICDRMEKEVRKKKRYRKQDIGSQISLQNSNKRHALKSSSSDTLCSEREPFIK